MVEYIVYISSGNGYYQVDTTSYKLSKFRDFEKQDTFEFTAPTKSPITPLVWCEVRDPEGGIVFRGAVVSGETNTRSTMTWTCISIPALLKLRYSFPMRWGSPAITSGYTALSIRNVLSDEAPQQTSGVAQYVPGIVWTANSLLSVSPTWIGDGSADLGGSALNGVLYYRGWGEGSRAGSCDVYLGGRKCAEVSDWSDIRSDYYQFWRGPYEDDPSALFVYGNYIGDTGPVYLDNAFDYGLRLGNIAKVDDKLLTAVDIGIEEIWNFIYEFLKLNGIYGKIRYATTYTYLDGSLSAFERGSDESPWIHLRPGEWSSLSKSGSATPTPAALIGLGGGVGITQEVYTRYNPNHKGPWIEELYEVSNGRREPLGNMESLVDWEWDRVSMADAYTIKYHDNLINPGDWICVYPYEDSDADAVTLQVNQVTLDHTSEISANLGGKRAAVSDVFLERQTSDAIENARSGQRFGSIAQSDYLGYTETFTMTWTPVAASNRDTQLVLFTLGLQEEGASDLASLAVTYTVTVNGTVIAILRNMPWGKDPVFEDLDITSGCKLDGTLETLTVTVADPSGTLNENPVYVGTVEGVGRYGQTPIATMTVDVFNPVSSTLTYRSGVSLINSSGGSVRGEALYNLPNIAKPAYDFKAVLAYDAWVHGATAESAWVQPYIKTYSETYWGVRHELSGTRRTFEDEWPTNPHSGIPWVQAELDDLQVGIVAYVKPVYVSPIYRNSYSVVTFRNLRVELR